MARLRDRDEAAFALVLDAWSAGLVRLARSFVSTADSATEVVQETWLAVIQGLDGFEGRSSLKTWVYRILVNTAKRRGAKESRSVPWSSLPAADDDGPTVDPARFRGPGDPWPGHWWEFPAPWPAPEPAALGGEVRARLRAAARTAARAAARRDHAARRRGLHADGGLRDPGDLGGQPAGAAAPGAGGRPGRTGGYFARAGGGRHDRADLCRVRRTGDRVPRRRARSRDRAPVHRAPGHVRRLQTTCTSSGRPSTRSATCRRRACSARPAPTCSPRSGISPRSRVTPGRCGDSAPA